MDHLGRTGPAPRITSYSTNNALAAPRFGGHDAQMQDFEIETSHWIALLISEWHHIADELNLRNRMRPPNIAISDQMQSTLGEWNRRLRTITIASYLLDRVHWVVAVDTLKHEVAHQIADEIYRAHREAPHGRAFRVACAALRIDPAARLTPERLATLHGTDGRQRERINKLMALGASENKHEAELALQRAQELSFLYNVELARSGAAPPAYTFRLVDRPMRRVSSYYWSVLSICTDYYFVQYITRPFLDSSGDRYRIIEMYGTPANLDVAEYVYACLLRAGEQEWQRFRRENDLRNSRQKLSFIRGLYDGFRQKLDASRATAEIEPAARALVLAGDPGLDSFYRIRNPRVTTRSYRTQHHADAHAAGHETGQSLQIRPGVRAERGSGVRGLID